LTVKCDTHLLHEEEHDDDPDNQLDGGDPKDPVFPEGIVDELGLSALPDIAGIMALTPAQTGAKKFPPNSTIP